MSGDIVCRLHWRRGELYREAADEIERLRAALLWLDNHEPELVAAAEEKFGFKLIAFS